MVIYYWFNIYYYFIILSYLLWISINIYVISWFIFYFLYCMHLWLLFLVLFYRLNYVFKDTIYKLSCFTFNSYRFILTIQPILIPIHLIFVWIIGDLQGLIGWIYQIIFTSSLSILFIYKLFQIYKHAQTSNDNDELLSIITRNTLLALISISITIIFLISWAFLSYYLIYFLMQYVYY